MQQQKKKLSVFVGNIPYDATEEQLKDICSAVGPVVSFRLVLDKDTGKPKGFGFCEYRDAETVNSAIRNLNNRDLNGRALRVDFADKERADTNPKEDRNPMHGGPPGQEISSSTTNHQILYEVLWSMKNLIATNPDQAKQILANHPVFSVSIVRALHTLSIIDDNVVSSLVAPSHEQAGLMHNQPHPVYTPSGPNYRQPLGYQQPTPGYNNQGYPQGNFQQPPFYQPPGQDFNSSGYPPGAQPGYPGQPQGFQNEYEIIQQLENLPTEQLESLSQQTNKHPIIDKILAHRRTQFPR